MLKRLKEPIMAHIGKIKHTNVILATVPYLCDLFENSTINKLIRQLNDFIRSLAGSNYYKQLLTIYGLYSAIITQTMDSISTDEKKACDKID